MNEQIPNNNILDIISKLIAIVEETLQDNKIVKTYSKINKIAHCIDDYNENLQ